MDLEVVDTNHKTCTVLLKMPDYPYVFPQHSMLFSFEEHQPHQPHWNSLSFQGAEDAATRFNYRPKTQRYNKKKFSMRNKTLEHDTIELMSDQKAV